MTEHENLAAALAAFQAELPRVGKGNTAKVDGKEGKRGYEYKYADLADVSSVVLPLLGKHGLSFTSKPTMEDGKFVLAYALRHAGGDVDVGSYPLVSGTPQQVGSAITYARRYALCAVTGVAPDGDDDGQAANDRWEQANEEDQASTAEGFALEIEHARDLDSLTTTLKSAMRSKAGRHITAARYDALFQQATVKRRELEKALTEAGESA